MFLSNAGHDDRVIKNTGREDKNAYTNIILRVYLPLMLIKCPTRVFFSIIVQYSSFAKQT